MEHGVYKEKLSALLDGELHGAEREEVLAHLSGCEDCRAYFAELGALRAELGDWEEYDAPEGFAENVVARLHAESASKSVKKRATWRGCAALAACAAVVLLAAYALPNALRMGGNNSMAQKSAAAGSAVYASPSSAPESAADAAPLPDPGSDYAYASGSGESGGDPGGMAQENARMEKNGAEDAAMSVTAGDGAANEGAYMWSAITADGDEKLPTANSGGMDADEPPMEPQERLEALCGEIPVLALSGEGAALWLAENGWQGESGAWYANAAALRALPEDLTLPDGGVPEGYDGPVCVELEEAGQ